MLSGCSGLCAELAQRRSHSGEAGAALRRRVGAGVQEAAQRRRGALQIREALVLDDHRHNHLRAP